MSLKTNYEYIRDWANAKFLKKTDQVKVDLDDYYTKREVNNAIEDVSSRIDFSPYMTKSTYASDEEVIAAALNDLNTRLKTCNDVLQNYDDTIQDALDNYETMVQELLQELRIPIVVDEVTLNTSGTAVNATTQVTNSLDQDQLWFIQNGLETKIIINNKVWCHGTLMGYTGYFCKIDDGIYVMTYDGVNERYNITCINATN